MNQVTNYYDQQNVAPGASTRRRRDVVDSGSSSENIAVSFQVVSPEIASKRKAGMYTDANIGHHIEYN